ncbi:glutathione S-transferase family protein [Oceanicoccus sagamiensis]|uniref:Glutathione S-transferase n=1 Tax=Oceanicoccus sagamiensis TaxID=716816 RepID=A0A1X9NDI2_9GAMM|nr:glutathione S-transferase family protein [Oceanicoccus sagamiensis]ARN75616.1 hypothetical protein BST96_16790 [Oceanicoccus sagamiensis]
MPTLYSAVGPSARTVRMFIAEKGLKIDQQEVNVLAGENLSDEMIKLNPGKQLPFMALDDGFILAESLAICEYLDESYPEQPLMGSNAKERAETRMWCRRIDLRIMEPAIQGTKASDAYEFFKDRYFLVVSGAKELKTLSQKNLVWLEQQLGNKPYICGQRFSLADIQLFSFLDFTKSLPKELTQLNRWFDAISARPSVAASQHPSVKV